MAFVSYYLSRILLDLFPCSKKKKNVNDIDVFHNGSQIKSFLVLELISLSGPGATSKFQKNFCFKMRAVVLINMKTRECKIGRHL